MATFSDIIQAAAIEMRMMAGVDVQSYAQPVLAIKLQAKFNSLFDMHFWPEYTTSETFTLDSSTGLIIEDTSAKIKRFVDIEYVWWSGQRDPLTRGRTRTNPTTVRTLTYTENGAAPSHGFIKLLPIGVGGTVSIRYRNKPNKFIDNDVMLLDEDFLRYAIIADYLTDEGTNAAAADKYNNMAGQRLQQLETLMVGKEHSMYQESNPDYLTWRDA